MLTIQGVDFFGLDGPQLGEIPTPNCKYQGSFYVCIPKSGNLTTVKQMQRAVDDMITDIPLWKAGVEQTGRPIQSSRAGYDGIVGPETSGLSHMAVVAAAQIRREAGEGDPDPAQPGVIFLARAETWTPTTKSWVEQRTQIVARYADEIGEYLAATHARINDLVAAAKSRAAAAKTEPSVYVEPPPMPPPDVISFVRPKPKTWPKVLAFAGGAAGMAAIALVAFGASKKPGEPESTMVFPDV